MGLIVRYAPRFRLTWHGQQYGPKLGADRLYLPADIAPHEIDPLLRAGQVDRVYTADDGAPAGPAPALAPPGQPALRGRTAHRPEAETAPAAPKPIKPPTRKATSPTGGQHGRKRRQANPAGNPG